MLFVKSAAAQYYTWGSDAPQKWSTLRTDSVRMIYPDTVAGIAARTLFYVRNLQPHISYGFSHGPMRIPFVMHPENFQSNGLVMYLPKRVEFLTSPAIGGYSMPWHKQLAAHEYRHAVQYNNLNQGVIRVLSSILGQQGSTIGLLFMPIWAMEGDATMSETMASSFGRGLQPSFSMGYRAMEGVGRTRDGRMRRNIDKWFCGSYRDYIPDHYELGYQMCVYSWWRYKENIWDRTVRFSIRNPYMITPTSIALNKYYDTSVDRLFRETFDRLEKHWAQLPAVEPSARILTDLPDGDYTSYRWPQVVDGGRVVLLKSDYTKPSRFVEIDPSTGSERPLAFTGMVSTRPAAGGGRVWWTEYRRSKLFEQRVNSQLCYMDLDDCRPRAERKVRRALYPTPYGRDGRSVAWIDYSPDGRYSLVMRETDGAAPRRVEAPRHKEIHGLAWDDVTEAFYLLVTDDDGMHIARFGDEGLVPVTEPAYITLSNLRAGGGRLYYGSIRSGRDEVHLFDLALGREYRMSQSRYGGFDAAPWGDSIVMTDYSRRGYAPAVNSGNVADGEMVGYSRLPENIVNPPLERWPVVNLDTVRFLPADSAAQAARFRTKRYRKVPNLVNIHSWMPLAFNPFDLADEQHIDLNAGLTLISQNLLSNTEAYASYGWNRNEGSLWNLGIRYYGLGVRFDVAASYGGNQLFYRLSQFDEQTSKPVYQTTPSPDRYYSFDVSASLPLYFQSGYHSRTLSFSAGWNYSNGMVADMDGIEWENGKISNIQRVGFEKGLHKLSFSAGFSDYVQLSHRDFLPRWGYSISAAYTVDPANDDFSDLAVLYGVGYLAGFAPHHSIRVAASYQTSIGGYKFPTGYAPLSYRSTRLIPRGFSSSDILSNDYSAYSLDYQLPLCYPEGGVGSILYFKRIRLNVGGDFARFRDMDTDGLRWRELWSVGGDLLFDINIFRQPAAATSTVKLSLYHPSSGGVWFGASVGLPF